MEVRDGKKVPTWNDIHKASREYEELKRRAIKAHTFMRSLRSSAMWHLLTEDEQRRLSDAMGGLEAVGAHA